MPAPLADHQFDLADVPGAAPALPNPRSHRFGQPPIDPAQLQGTRWTPPAKSWGSAGAGPVLDEVVAFIHGQDLASETSHDR